MPLRLSCMEEVSTQRHSQSTSMYRLMILQVLIQYMFPYQIQSILGLNPRARSMGDTFLVCVHNVADDQPYAILRASINSTASDIIRQVLGCQFIRKIQAFSRYYQRQGDMTWMNPNMFSWRRRAKTQRVAATNSRLQEEVCCRHWLWHGNAAMTVSISSKMHIHALLYSLHSD